MIMLCVGILAIHYLPSEFLLVLHAQGEFLPPLDSGLAPWALPFPLYAQYWRDAPLSVCCSNFDPNIPLQLHPLKGHVFHKAVGAAHQDLIAHGILKGIEWVVDPECRKVLYKKTKLMQFNDTVPIVLQRTHCKDFLHFPYIPERWHNYVGRRRFCEWLK